MYYRGRIICVRDIEPPSWRDLKSKINSRGILRGLFSVFVSRGEDEGETAASSSGTDARKSSALALSSPSLHGGSRGLRGSYVPLLIAPSLLRPERRDNKGTKIKQRSAGLTTSRYYCTNPVYRVLFVRVFERFLNARTFAVLIPTKHLILKKKTIIS